MDQVNAAERTLVLRQTGLEFIPGKGVTVADDRHEFAIGSRNARLQVVTTADTRVYLNGQEKTFGDLAPGTQVIVVGRAAGESLEATAITDLTPVEPPPGVREALQKRAAEAVSNPRITPLADEVSWCVAQDLDYPDSDVLEFKGCWGFPVVSDAIDVDVPFVWVLLGYLKIDYFSYTAGLSGESYAWPFRFTAAPSTGLVYHVPGTISLGVQGLPALPGSFTFSGGLGVDFGMNIDFCTFFGECSDLETFHAGIGQIYESMEAAPTDPQTYLDIEEPTCLSAGVFPIKGFSPLSVSYCWDLRFQGTPFMATVKATRTPGVPFAFERGTYDLSVRPESTAVKLAFTHMSWKPPYTVGGYFSFSVFDVDFYSTPNLFEGAHDPLGFISDPFPGPGMMLAHTRSGDLVYQPSSIALTLPVAPAPTHLTITSAQGVPEGTPVTVRLSEAYDGSAVPGQSLTITASGVGGTPSVEAPVTTNDLGIASLHLPPGEYQIGARYDGAPTYEPASAAATRVVVYRPTTFVIWGGNTGGIAPGARVQFWGHGWSTQVLDGSYGGNASFQGFAVPFGENMWEGPPGSSGHGPATIPDVIGVIITTHVEGRGSNTVGNIAGYAVLRVDDPATYSPNGGHAATGVVLTTPE